MLPLRCLKQSSRFSWSLSNLAALLRMDLFIRHKEVLNKWSKNSN